MAFLSGCAPALSSSRWCVGATSYRARRPLTRRAPPCATLAEKFSHLRNAAVPPVSDTIAKFVADFARPVPIVYRALINELLTTSHLAVYCALWQYDALFAAGFEHVFSAFLSYYPNADERSRLRLAVAKSLNLDAERLAADAAAVAEWVADCADADALFAKLAEAPENSDDPVVRALRAPQKAASYEFYYSRCFGIGLVTMMLAVNEDVTVDNAEKWARKLGLEPVKLSAETSVYNSGMERLKQAEQIFAEAAAREAKKTAERLAKRAEAAQKKLQEIEKAEAEEKSSGVSENGTGAGDGSDADTLTATTAKSTDGDKSS